MTWSIIAKDPETGSFAVGALCPHGAGRIGADRACIDRRAREIQERAPGSS